MPIGIITSIAAHVGLFGLFVLVLLSGHKPHQSAQTPPVMVDLVPQTEFAARSAEKTDPTGKDAQNKSAQSAAKEPENKTDQSAEKPEKPVEKTEQPAEKPQQAAEKPEQATGALAPTPEPASQPQPQPPPEPPQKVVPDQPPVAPPKPVELPTLQQAEADSTEQPKPSTDATKPEQTPEQLEEERQAAAFRLAKQYGAILVIPDSPVGGPPKKSTDKFSKPELAALKAHLDKCWSAPAGIAQGEHLMVTMRVSLTRQGALTDDPSLIQASASRHGPALVKSAAQALKSCQPFSMLPAKKYKDWKTLDLNFSPRGLTSG